LETLHHEERGEGGEEKKEIDPPRKGEKGRGISSEDKGKNGIVRARGGKGNPTRQGRGGEQELFMDRKVFRGGSGRGAVFYRKEKKRGNQIFFPLSKKRGGGAAKRVD